MSIGKVETSSRLRGIVARRTHAIENANLNGIEHACVYLVNVQAYGVVACGVGNVFRHELHDTLPQAIEHTNLYHVNV